MDGLETFFLKKHFVKEENGGVGPWTMCMTRGHQQHYVQRGGQVWGLRCMGDGYRSHQFTTDENVRSHKS
jgi:hypothetical protein